MAILLIPKYRKPNKNIIQEPDLRLRKVSQKVENIDDKTYQITSELINTLKKIDKPFLFWLGMAAPQIGYKQRIIAVKRFYNNYLVMINPEIVEQKFLLPTLSACYSLKGLYLIKSHYWLKVKYQTLTSKFHTDQFWGGQAILLQQEIDHLNGKLICD